MTVHPRVLRITVSYIAIFTTFLLLLLATPAHAQEDSSTVTADDVNTIARKMYCPVCENIPLDVCPTAACAQWRAEIRSQLEAGQTEDQIISDFVARYGDQVVGTPQDPMLRTLSLVTPWVIAGIIALVAGVLLVRWWSARGSMTTVPSTGETKFSDDDYRARLERDLQARR